jgi:hypothetical protein
LYLPAGTPRAFAHTHSNPILFPRRSVRSFFQHSPLSFQFKL